MSETDLEREGDIAADFLEELLDIADLDGDIDIDVDGDRAAVEIIGGNLSHLVGRDGEVLDALQELTRLAAHLDEIERLVQKGGEIGKRLDFMIQELHREANTLGSKSAALELTKISVDMKVLIEQLREQVQNIE